MQRSYSYTGTLLPRMGELNMKRFLLAAAIAVTTPVFAADVGVSVTVGQPGFYGTIDIGDFPRPVLVYPEPIIVQRAWWPRQPIYMHVPPGHAMHWDKHCHKYDACGRRVYFVQDSWYNDVYVPEHRRRHGGGGPGNHPGKVHGFDKDHGSSGKDHGQGKGNKGKGKKD